MKRRFKITPYIDERGQNWKIYESTVMVKNSKLISDQFHKRQRIRLGGFDNDFTVMVKKRRK